MSTPQDPNQPGDPNQPPVDPNQPYGSPQPPQYGAPQPPQYGAPTPQYGTTPPPTYGTPQGGAPYGGAMPPQSGQEPGKGMAIGALVLAILGFCGITWIASVILGIIVLVRSKKGQAGGRGLAIAALIIDALWFLGGVAFVIIAVVVGLNTTSVDDLKSGDCVTAKGLADDSDTVNDLKVVACSKSHDGEVVATKKLSKDDADGYDSSAANDLCFAAIQEEHADEMAALLTEGISVIGLTQTLSPDPGDQLACVAYNADGSKLSDPLFP